MPSPLQWISIDLYQYMINLIWLSPIQWNPNEQQFAVLPFTFRLIPWYFLWIVCTFGYGILGSVYVPIRELISPTGSVSIVQNIALIAILLITGFYWGINCSVIFLGRRSVLVVNRLITLYKDLTDHGMFG
jgi:hypothetical protein